MTTPPRRPRAQLAVAPTLTGPDATRLARLLDRQEGLVTRDQVLACGYDATEIRRRVRRHEWTRLDGGVLSRNTGPLTWNQRAWAALLGAWPAALTAESAWRAAGGPGRFNDDDPIIIAVDERRRLPPRPGVELRRTTRLPLRALWDASPPRMRFEDVTLDLAADASGATQAINWISEAIRARLTTPDRLHDALAARPDLPQRQFLATVLRDIRLGTCRGLAHIYDRRIAAAHDLPLARTCPGDEPSPPGRHTVSYPTYAVEVVLDGRFTSPLHGRPGKVPDLRSTGSSLDRVPTCLHLTWREVLDAPCGSAARVAAALGRAGWPGALTRCARCPPDPAD